MAECFKESKAIVHIHLHPSRVGQDGNVMAGVEEILNQYVMSYVDDLGGVVVMYRDVKLKEQLGTIFFERPHINFHVQARFLVFAPKIGDMLVGEVNKVAHDHIGMLVAGVFNVTLPKEGLPKLYSFDSVQERWYQRESKAKGPKAGKGTAGSGSEAHDILSGSFVRFQITSMSNTDGYFSMSGSITGKDTGPVTALTHLGLTLPRRVTMDQKQDALYDPEGDHTDLSHEALVDTSIFADDDATGADFLAPSSAAAAARPSSVQDAGPKKPAKNKNLKKKAKKEEALQKKIEKKKRKLEEKGLLDTDGNAEDTPKKPPSKRQKV